MEIFSKIAGVSFNKRQASIKGLSTGELLTLAREPDNKYDRNAIKVITNSGIQIGYIGAGLAAELASLIDKGVKLSCKVLKVTGGKDRNFGCNILIRGDKTNRQGLIKTAECNWCSTKIEDIKEAVKWEGVYFCTDKCLDKCRASQ